MPSRFTVFQCKKGNTSPSSLKAEAKTKATQKSDEPDLNEALAEAIAQNGAYIIITNTPVVGTNVDRRIIGIREGITETKNDPDTLSAIEIYDCNKLAAWTNSHPAIALWLNSIQRHVHLAGFQTFEDWGRDVEISDVPYQLNDDKRFLAKGAEIQAWLNDDATISEAKNFYQIYEVIETFFQTKGSVIRVIGPSGFGKTRFIYEAISQNEVASQDVFDCSQIIYCNYDDVGGQIVNIVRDIADSGSRALLIVDDCPDALHKKLFETVSRDGSCCHLVTLGVETKSQGIQGNLVIELNAASEETITNIADSLNAEISKRNASLIRDLSQGFPRMAVFASRALEIGDEEITSVDALISRIIWGNDDEDMAAMQYLQLLSLFTIVGMENTASDELEELATYQGISSRDIFSSVSRFSARGVLFRQGDFAEAQPLPLAMRLANMWLESNPDGTLESLFRSLSEKMKLRMVGRLRWVSWSDKVSRFASGLIIEALPDEIALDSEFGSTLLDRFVHLAPDATMQHLDMLLGDKTIDELKEFSDGRRNTIWALEKLVFRRQSFDKAARLLLRLGAGENESWSNNATGQFIGLFKLYLSGTEASPEERLLVLDDGLASDDKRIREICVKSLDTMLDQGHFSRSGGQEVIGSAQALQDWRPEFYSEIYDFSRSALIRLERIALNQDDEFSKVALDAIGSHLRALISIQPMFDEIQGLIERLNEKYPDWYKPILAVNSWLFFDRNAAEQEHIDKLREYHDSLLPTDTIDLLVFYSSGWTSDISDPDISYDREGENDHYYASRKIEELIASSSTEASFFLPLIDKLMEAQTNSAWIVVNNVAKHIDDPIIFVEYITEKQFDDENQHFLISLIKSSISGASQSDRLKAIECLDFVLTKEGFSSFYVEFIAAVGVDNALIVKITEYIRNDVVAPYSVLSFGFNDLLNTVDDRVLENLIGVLLGKSAAGGWSTVDFLSRITYGIDIDSEWLVNCIMQSITNPSLFEKDSYTHMDWYHWCDLAKKMFAGGHITEERSINLIAFILRVLNVDEFNVQLGFDKYAQEILRRLIADYPQEIWNAFHRIKDSSEPISKYRLNSLFGSDIGDPSTPGVLNDIPPEIYVPWMLENKDERLGFILSWMALIEKVDEKRQWINSFVAFIDAHVDSIDQLSPIVSRLTTGSWMGSYANKLETERELLLELKELSQNSYVVRWINNTMQSMERQIEDERRRDANREATYRA